MMTVTGAGVAASLAGSFPPLAAGSLPAQDAARASMEFIPPQAYAQAFLPMQEFHPGSYAPPSIAGNAATAGGAAGSTAIAPVNSQERLFIPAAFAATASVPAGHMAAMDPAGHTAFTLPTRYDLAPPRPQSPERPPPRDARTQSPARSLLRDPRPQSPAPTRMASPGRPQLNIEASAGSFGERFGMGGSSSGNLGASLTRVPTRSPSDGKAGEEPPGSPQLRSSRGEDLQGDLLSERYYRERRQTDPFFYPTTVSPLTGFGLNAIEQTTPPKNSAIENLFASGSRSAEAKAGKSLLSREEAPLFVNAPLQSFVDQPEEMNLLQQQNDNLARQVQALEHAKSLAAVQSAQAMQKIRSRQEQLRRETQQAYQQSKEIQAEFALPSLDSVTAPGSMSPGQTVSNLALRSEARLQSQAGSMELPPGGSILADLPLWNQEAWRDSQAPPSPKMQSNTQLPQPDLGVASQSQLKPGLGDALPTQAHERVVGALRDSQARMLSAEKRALVNDHVIGQQAPGFNSTSPDNSASNRAEYGSGVPLPEVTPPRLNSVRLASHSSQGGAPASPQIAAAQPSLDQPPNDISVMANRILSSHNAPFLGSVFGESLQGAPPAVPSIATATGPAPYVDAMGNPLGPTTGRELPNIKDELPAPLPDLHSHERSARSLREGQETRSSVAMELGRPGQMPMGAGAGAGTSSFQSLAPTLPAGGGSSVAGRSSEQAGPAQTRAEMDIAAGDRDMGLNSARVHTIEQARFTGNEVNTPPQRPVRPGDLDANAQREMVAIPSSEPSASSARGPIAAHERVPLSARASQPPPSSIAAGSAAASPAAASPQVTEVEAAAEGRGAGIPIVETTGQQMQGQHLASGAADAAAGSAASPPPQALPPQPPAGPPQPPQQPEPAPAEPVSQPERRTRPQESPAPQRGVRRDNSVDNRGRRSRDEASPERVRRERSASKAADPQASAAQAGLPVEQSEQLQAELEECLDTIRWCAESVTRESLQDLKNTNRPPQVVKDVLEAVALLLNQSETKWDKLKRLIGSPTFLEKIQRLSFQQSVTREQFRKLRERLQHPDFDEEQIKSVCVPVVPLAMWCRAIGVYLSKTKFRGGPEIRPVAAAGAANPQPQQQLERRASPSTYMIFNPDLATLSDEELRCVKDLTISRPDVGEITFHGNTDVTNLDFERIVRLEIGEVLVYPDSSLKPDVGVGLNKAATVTMYQCWPPNGNKLLEDPNSQERYKKKIKTMTEEKHARFIDYDCGTGIWKFSVEHF